MELIRPTGVHHLSVYSPAARVGNTIYVAGHTAWDENGNVVGVGDFRAQAERVYQNIQKVLETAGVSFQHVVKINTYMTNVDDFPAYREVMEKYFAGHAPASAAVVVKALAMPEFLIEVEVIAVAES